MWHTFEIDGHWCQAKVYYSGSNFGINGGRVSKLAICDGKNWDSQKIIYNYDRGLDVNNAPTELVNKVVAYCEGLPK